MINKIKVNKHITYTFFSFKNKLNGRQTTTIASPPLRGSNEGNNLFKLGSKETPVTPPDAFVIVKL